MELRQNTLLIRAAKLAIILAGFCGSFQALAEIKKLDHAGIVRGGAAEAYMSLLDVRRKQGDLPKSERVELDWGNQLFHATAKGGYFSVEYKENPPRLILTLDQVMATKFDSNAKIKQLAGSAMIERADIHYDPIGQAHVLTLSLRKPVHVLVSSYQGIVSDKSNQPAKLVIDLNPRE